MDPHTRTYTEISASYFGNFDDVEDIEVRLILFVVIKHHLTLSKTSDIVHDS